MFLLTAKLAKKSNIEGRSMGNRWAIITYKHGKYELPHELQNVLRVRIIGN